ncbi:MAG: hypothetical protein NT075_25155 [Chloroflexi bacterium]|nr:hypothetical protein [Chloroflexota bacterium]
MLYAIHEHELRPDVDPARYESDVAAALQQMQVPGLLQAIHLKGFHGERAGRYTVLWIFENAEALTHNFGTAEQRKFPADWLYYENEILARYLDRDPDTIDYTDYNLIKEFKFQQ